MLICVQCLIYNSDCNVLYCCVGKVLCMHIFNKEFRVLKKKKDLKDFPGEGPDFGHKLTGKQTFWILIRVCWLGVKK